MMRVFALASAATVLSLTGPAAAQDVRITPDRAEATFQLNGHSVTISRMQDQSHTLTGDFARTARACPPDCIQPLSVARGVDTMAELEVISFLQRQVNVGTGLLIDARMPERFAAGSIPGAVNVPTATVAANNPYRPDILKALGAVPGSRGDFDFGNALELLIFSDGPWSSTAADMVRNLLEAGYPPEKLHYYRGGMQAWMSFGLTTARPQNQG